MIRYRDKKFCGLKLTVLMLFLLSMTHGAVADTIVTINGSKVIVESNILTDSSLSGEGPGDISIVYVENDSTSFTVFRSCGCSEYTITQSSRGIQIDVYSDLSAIWRSDCCAEDQLPLSAADADIIFSFSYCGNVLSGRIQIIGNMGKFVSTSVPSIDYVATHPDENFAGFDEPYYRSMLYLMTYYRSSGCSNAELYDFISTFEREMARKNILTERDDELRQIEFQQVCDLFQFALQNENVDLGIDKLKILGKISEALISYYNPYNLHSKN